jgi:FtsP/CotA-like multicopper oxidase with cupredoxin domain
MTATIAPTQSYGGTPRLGFLNYDNKIPGPTFIVRPGQRFNLAFNNQLSEITNLHFHGMHVSPGGISDNVFLKPAPGTTQKYTLDIPRNQPGGMYWYHPHMHELAQAQLDRGLAGAIIVEGGHKLHPALREMRQRVMLLQWLQYDPLSAQVNPDPLQFTLPYMTMLNGVHEPLMKMRPGESQYWHIGNATGTVWYTLRLDGFDITVVAEDGNPLPRPRKVEQLEFAPAKRFEVVVTARGAGYYAMKTLGKNVDGVFSWIPETLATVSVEGNAVPSLPAPEYLVDDPEWLRRDLRKVPVAHTRTVTFTQHLPSDDLPPPAPGGAPPGGTPPGPFVLDRSDFKFFVDGLLYDENIVNTTVDVNSVEEWTIINDSDDAHAFHIHVNPFEVVAVDGTSLDVPYWADTAIINGRVGATVPHSITFRTRFADYPGRFVYHCHNLFHEDQGMMAVIDVVRPKR